MNIIIKKIIMYIYIYYILHTLLVKCKRAPKNHSDMRYDEREKKNNPIT
jgi:hypothetical protein